MKKNYLNQIALGLGLAVLLNGGLMAQQSKGGNYVQPNAAGGVSAGSARAGKTVTGATYGRSSGVVTDASGNVAAASGGAVKTANGATAARGSRTTRVAGGGVNRTSGASAQGINGAASTSGSTTVNRDGSISANRTNDVKGVKGSYTGATTYATGQGLTHTKTCKDPAGNVVPCPKAPKQ